MIAADTCLISKLIMQHPVQKICQIYFPSITLGHYVYVIVCVYVAVYGYIAVDVALLKYL